jgi:hypothetical protein
MESMFVECLVREYCEVHVVDRQWLALGVMIRLGFFGLLRPTELRSLRRRDLALPSDICLGSAGQLVVAIAKPKTAKHFGKTQFVVIDEVCCIAWAEVAFASLMPDEKLFPGSDLVFDSLFWELLVYLEISGMGFTLASLRAGGATFFYRAGYAIEWLRFRGRWKAQSTLEHYIQEGTSLLLNACFSSQTRGVIASTLAVFPTPPLPRQCSSSRNGYSTQ